MEAKEKVLQLCRKALGRKAVISYENIVDMLDHNIEHEKMDEETAINATAEMLISIEKELADLHSLA